MKTPNFSQMKNRSLSERTQRGKPVDKLLKPVEVPITLEYSQKTHLWGIFRNELVLYNALVGSFLPFFSRDPDVFLNLDPTFPKVFGELCFAGTDIMGIKNIKLSPELEFLTNRKYTELERIFSEVAKTPSGIIPETKKSMGVSILKFFMDQAKAKKENVMINSFGEVEYRTPPSTLNILDGNMKRHCQIFRKSTEYHYDDENEVTKLTLPYFNIPIIIPINLYKFKWDTIILHQETGKMANSRSPWFATLKISHENYLIHYKDHLPSRTMFQECKSRGFIH